MLTNRNLSSKGGAFTLVEVLIVLIILGILAAIVVPQFSNASQNATLSTLQTTLDTLRDSAELMRQKSPTSEYPATVDSTWFASGIGPKHPENVFGVANIEVEDASGKTHPTNKVLITGIGGAFWYNPAEGIFRARVADQGTSSSTLTFYNQVNESSESALGNYAGGGGGFGS